MILGIKHSAQGQGKKLLESFYELRYRVFIERLKWSIPTDGVREKDQFDHDQASYLLLQGEEGQCQGGVRLTRYEDSNLTKDVFSYLIQEPFDQSLNTWEISRVVVDDKGETIKFIRKSTLELFIAIFKECLAHGVEQIITTSEARIERILRMIGCPLQRLGPAVQMDGVYVVVGILPVNQGQIDAIESWMARASGMSRGMSHGMGHGISQPYLNFHQQTSALESRV